MHPTPPPEITRPVVFSILIINVHLNLLKVS
jgi:hypothetical protein